MAAGPGMAGAGVGPPAEAITRWVLRGDRQALAEIITAHQDSAYGLALQITGSHAEAEDAVQEAFLAVAVKARQFSHAASLRSWILAIVANCARQQLRGAARRQRHEQLAARAAGSGSHEDSPACAVDEELARLPAHEREAVFLRCVEGLSFQEIACALRIREPAARKRVGRCLGRLRAAYGIDRDDRALLALLAIRPPRALRPLSDHVARQAAWAAPAVGGGGVAILMTLAALALATSLAVAVPAIAAHHARRERPAQPGRPPLAAPVAAGDRPLQDLLDDAISIHLQRATLPDAMQHLCRAVPPRRLLPWAAPADWGMGWNGETGRVTLPEGTRRIRQVLDDIAQQLQLSWSVARDVVCFTNRLAPARSAAMQERFLHPQILILAVAGRSVTLTSADCRRGAALDLAQSVERSDMRLLLVHAGDRDPATALAARAGVQRLVGDPMVDGALELLSPLALFGEDPAVEQAVAGWHAACGDRDVALIDAVSACRLRSALPWLLPLAGDLDHEPSPAQRFTAPLLASDSIGGALFTFPPMALSVADHAIIALGSLGDRRAQPVLLHLLAACTDRCVLHLLAVALCRIGDPSALPALVARQRTLPPAPATPGNLASWYQQPLLDCLSWLDVDQASEDALKAVALDPAAGGTREMIGGNARQLTERIATLADAGTLPDLSGWYGLEREPRIERPLLALLQAQAHPGWPLLSAMALVGGDQTVAALQERALAPGAETQSFANALACMDLPSAGTAFRRVASAYLERGPGAVQSVAGDLLIAPDPGCQALLAQALAVDRPPAVRMAFMNGCADCWPPSATTLLIELVIKDPDQDLRRAAYCALLRMHLEDGTAAWLRTQQDPWLRAAGVAHGGHDDLLSSLPALPDLLHATGDPSSEVRCAALGRLVRLLAADVADTPPVLAEALRRWFSALLKNDPSADVRAWAQQGLQALGPLPPLCVAPGAPPAF